MSRITVLCENTAGGHGLLAEHGLSFWIEHDNHRILFDTGQGYVLTHNAQQLGIRLETADAVVLSHGHYDHTGGLHDLLEAGSVSTVFAHPVAFTPRYVRDPDGASREIGIPRLDEQAVRRHAKVILTEQPTEICPGVYATGPVPQRTDFEDTGGAFYADRDCKEPDEFPDDQALYFQTKRGSVVILGCAHAGVINTLQYVLKLTDNQPLHTVIGGMHLVSANRERIDKTVEALRRLDVQRLLPAHCTGFPAMARLWNEFPDRYRSCPVGTVLDIDR
jgi:7,8-dihydropterin-6-yl-methyl-4-(beta-D-ribofuranosyl)aminobenzene 5'-phosphate synthase